MNESMLEILSHVVEMASTVIISRYDPSHQARPILYPKLTQNQPLYPSDWVFGVSEVSIREADSVQYRRIHGIWSLILEIV